MTRATRDSSSCRLCSQEARSSPSRTRRQNFLQAQPEARDLGLPVHLRPQLPLLGLERLVPPLQFASPAPVLIEAHHALQVGLGQALDLPPNAGLAAPEGLPTRLQLLRQPVCPPCARSRARRIASG